MKVFTQLLRVITDKEYSLSTKHKETDLTFAQACEVHVPAQVQLTGRNQTPISARFFTFYSFPLRVIRLELESAALGALKLAPNTKVKLVFTLYSRKYACPAKVFLKYRQTVFLVLPPVLKNVQRRSSQRYPLIFPLELRCDFREASQLFLEHLEAGLESAHIEPNPRVANISRGGLAVKLENTKRSLVPIVGQRFRAVVLKFTGNIPDDHSELECNIELCNVVVREDTKLDQKDVRILKSRDTYLGFRFYGLSDESKQSLEVLLQKISAARSLSPKTKVESKRR